MMEHLVGFQWYIAWAASLGLAGVVGFLLGRRHVASVLEPKLHSVTEALEWEKAQREQLLKRVEQTSISPQESGREEVPESAHVTVLRHEVDRLRRELHQSWEAQIDAEQKLRQLEARLAVLVGRAPLRATPRGEEGRTRSAQGTLQLWNHSAQDGPEGGPSGP